MMRNWTLVGALGLLLAAAGTTQAALIIADDLLVSLDARDLPPGQVTSDWRNMGSLVGDFSPNGAPMVENIDDGTISAQAVTLDGNDWLGGPTSPDGIEGAGTRSIEVWAYNPTIIGEETIVAWGHRGGPEGSNMGLNYGNDVSWGAVTHWGGGTHDMGWWGAHSPAPAAGNWWHFAYTYEPADFGTDARALVYVNGVQESERTWPQASELNTYADCQIKVGTQNDDAMGAPSTLYFSGSVAVVRIHDGALSADDVLNNYNAGITSSPSGGTLISQRTGDWNDDVDPRTWNGDVPGYIPRPDSDVLVTSGHVVTIQPGADPGLAGRLNVDGNGQVVVGTSQLLSVTNRVIVEPGSVLILNDNATLSAGSGSSIDSLVAATGNAVIDVRGSMTANYTDAVGGTLTKQGNGRLSLGGVSAVADSVFQVDAGTLEGVSGTSALGAAETLRLNGGTFLFADERGAPGPGPADHKVAHWSFDQAPGSGGPVVDEAGNYHGTLMGGADFSTEGVLGNALVLDGVDSYVDLPDGMNSWTDGFSVAAWVKTEAYTNWARVIDFGNGAGVDCILVAQRGVSDDLRFEVHDGIGPGGPTLDPDNVYMLDQWQHLVATIDNDADHTAHIYLDGVVIASGSVTLPTNVTRTNNYIGESNWEADAFFQGLMDEIYMYNRALTPLEIANLVAQRTPPDLSGVQVTVTGDSQLKSDSVYTATFKGLTMMDGAKLTTSGTGGIRFEDPAGAADTIIDSQAAAVAFDLQAETDFGTIDANLAAVTITKNGPFDMVLEEPNDSFDNGVFDARGGRLIAVHEGIGDADLILSGGEMILAARTDATDVSFHAPTVEADSVLTAGSGGVGAIGPLVVTLGSETEDVVLHAGRLTMRATDDYGIYIPGAITGGGSLELTAGHVTIDKTISVGDLALVGGTLTRTRAGTPDGDVSVTGNLTLGSDSLIMTGSTLTTSPDTEVVVARDMELAVDDPLEIANLNTTGTVTGPGITAADVDIHPGGRISSSGPVTADNLNVSGRLYLTGTGEQRNVTIHPGGTLSLIGSNLDLEGALLEASETTVTVGVGRTLSYDKALTVASLDLAGTYALRGTGPGTRDITITPGGTLTMSSGAVLNMTGLTSGTLTTTESEIEIVDGDLTVGNELSANKVTVREGLFDASAGVTVADMVVTGGRVDTNASHVTVGNSLTLKEITYTIDGQSTFTAGGSDLLRGATLTFGGVELDVSTGLTPVPGVIAHWALDETGGTTAADSVGGHHGTLIDMDPATDWVPGRMGNALDFDGVNDKVSVDSLGANLPEMSVSVWVNNRANGWRSIFHTKAWAAGDLHYIVVDNQILFACNGMGQQTGGNPNDFWSNGVLPQNQWTNVASTYSLNDHMVRIYINGILDRETYFTGNNPIAFTNGLFMGSDNGGGGRWLDGQLDELRIYNRALSGEEVGYLFGGGIPVDSINQPHTHFMVTASSTLNAEVIADAVFGNLTLENGADLELSGASSVSFNDVINTQDSTIIAPTFVRGVLSPGGSDQLATLTVGGLNAQGTPVGGLELADAAEYACEVGQSMANDLVVSTKDAWLSGTLSLRALSKLEPPDPQGIHWRGDQTRTILSTVGDSSVRYTFLEVPEDRECLGYGVFATNQGGNGQVVTYGINAVQVDLFQAANGDVDGDREVGSTDIQKILGANTFPGRNPATWETGDFNADGWCNSADIQLLLATNLFDTGPYAAPQPAPPVEDQVRLILSPTAGGLQNVQLDAGGLAITSYLISSAEGALSGQEAANLGLFTQDDDFVIAGAGLSTLLEGVHDLGAVIGPGLDSLEGLSLTYTIAGVPGVYRGRLELIPEPGTVVMLLAGALGLLWLALRRQGRTA